MNAIAQSTRTTRIRLTSRGTQQREETHMDGQDEQDKSLKRRRYSWGDYGVLAVYLLGGGGMDSRQGW